MRLKLDENLGRRGAELLRQAGHEVTTVPEQRLCGATDAELIAACSAENRGIVTLDLDFGNLLFFRPSNYAGIAVLRFPSRLTPGDLLDAIRTLIAGLAQRQIAARPETCLEVLGMAFDVLSALKDGDSCRQGRNFTRFRFLVLVPMPRAPYPAQGHAIWPTWRSLKNLQAQKGSFACV